MIQYEYDTKDYQSLFLEAKYVVRGSHREITL